MDKPTFIKKWIPLIGLGIAMPEKERVSNRREATVDLELLTAPQWWRKWGEFYCGWPGGNIKKQVLEDLTQLLNDLKRLLGDCT